MLRRAEYHLNIPVDISHTDKLHSNKLLKLKFGYLVLLVFENMIFEAKYFFALY